MKKFIKHILFFFVIVIAIDFIIGQTGDYLVSHVKYGDAKRTNDLLMVDKHDVIIMGSSRARHHYDTPFLSDTLGLDVYNAGFDGNGVILAYGLLELMLERYQPKLIVFDVEPAFDIVEYKDDNYHKRYITRLKPYYKNEAVGDIIKSVSLEEWYKVHSGMLRYNMNLLTMFAEEATKRGDYIKGFYPLQGDYKRSLEQSKTQAKTEHVVLKNDLFKLDYMEKLVKLAKAKEIPLLIVASPKYGKVDSKDLQPVVDICKKYNIPLVDYYANEECMNHTEWFKEPMHLNATGARYFSRLVSSDIRNFIDEYNRKSELSF